MEWHIGCSGFHYKHWKGSFYPGDLPQRRWFEFYAQHFSTLELNVTFYRFPKLSFLQNWNKISPPEFRFSVKAPRAITHFKQFHNVADMITSFYATTRDGLGDKLGPVLFQLPPRLKYDEARLQRILETLDPGFNNVLEFRHASWWQDTVYTSLAKRGITFCGMSHPELPDVVIKNTPVVYYRFHGVPDLYRSSYPDGALNNVALQLKDAPNLQSAWLYFNNDAAVAAIPNAETLIRLTGNG